MKNSCAITQVGFKAKLFSLPAVPYLFSSSAGGSSLSTAIFHISGQSVVS